MICTPAEKSTPNDSLDLNHLLESDRSDPLSARLETSFHQEKLLKRGNCTFVHIAPQSSQPLKQAEEADQLLILHLLLLKLGTVTERRWDEMLWVCDSNDVVKEAEK